MEPIETPPSAPKRRRYKWLRRLGWAAVWVISLIALFYVHQGWQGRRAWKAYAAEADAAGEHLDTESVIPPPIPDEENLAMAPLFKPLFEYERAEGGYGPVTYKDPAHKEALDSMKLPVSFKSAPIRGWRQGAVTDLSAWQARFAEADGGSESTGDPAPAVLKSLERFNPWLIQLEEAAETRSRSRFPFRYDEGMHLPLAHAISAQGFGQILRLRASARLAAGKEMEASRDVLLVLRLQDAFGADPILIGYLVSISLQEMAMTALWEGLVTHRWNDPQLQAFQERLAEINHAAQFESAIRGERNLFAFPTIEMLRSNRSLLVRFFTDSQAVTTTQGNAFAPALTFIPGGWLDLNKAAIGRNYQRLLSVADPNPPRFYPDRAEAVVNEVDRDGPLRHDPRLLFARLALPAFTLLPNKSAAAQGTADLALIALALERHLLRHGTYPDALEKIDEDLRGSRGIPQDCATGRPARYALSDGGSYTIYYDGWNGRDDGGQLGTEKQGSDKLDLSKGDWVWPQVVEP